MFSTPPPDEPGDHDAEMKSLGKVSERTGKRSLRIRDPKSFQQRTEIAEDSNLLKWAGQYRTASIRDRQLERGQPDIPVMPNAPLLRRETELGVFQGTEEALFPQLGARNLRVFTGVEEQLLNSVIQGHPREGRAVAAPQHVPDNVSVSRTGTCMIVEGL